MPATTGEEAWAMMVFVASVWFGTVVMAETHCSFAEEGNPGMAEIAAAVLAHPFIAANYHVSSANGVHVFSLVQLNAET